MVLMNFATAGNNAGELEDRLNPTAINAPADFHHCITHRPNHLVFD